MAESSNSEPSAEDVGKQQFDFSSSDFATIATTAAFVDRTLMIRDVYNASSRMLITAPPKFGKTTNMDMVKRFFEITVDNTSGKTKAVVTTENYQLFKDNNLEICKDADFFNEHFGKRPVLHIDFKPLNDVTGFEEMIEAFKYIVTASFGEHRYLLKNPSVKILFDDVADFRENYLKKFFHKRLIKDVDIVDLENSFEYLSVCLYKHFGKKVFVLIDNYDSYFCSLLFRANDDAEEIISFLRSSIRSVLDDKSVERVLITGSLAVIDGVFTSNVSFIEWYQFLNGCAFTKYYGLTCDDLDDVLNKLVPTDEERCDVKHIIDDYYQAYNSQTQGVEVYNTWTVLQYLLRRRAQSRWCQRKYVNNFEKCLKIVQLRTCLEDLLITSRYFDVSQPFSVVDVLKLNKIITGAKVQNFDDGEVDAFCRLFCQMGYLSVNVHTAPYGDAFSVASEEIKCELAKVLFNGNGELYEHSSYGLPDAYNICSAINAIRVDGTEVDENIETFVKKIKWDCFISSDWNFTKSLFMNIVTCVHGKDIRMLTWWYSKWNDGRIAILLKNRHQVAICITHSATNSCDAFKALRDKKFNVFGNIRGKVIIGVDKQDFTYSYCSGQEDSLRESKTIKWKN